MNSETLAAPASALNDAPSSSADFSLLFDAIPTPILVLDRETLRFLRVNDAALRFYGYTPDEFAALTLAEIRPESRQGEIEGMIARFDDPSLPETPRLHLTKAGETRIVKVNARLFDHQGTPAILAAVCDMTKEHELQREARAAKAFLRNVIEKVPAALFVKEADTGQFVLYNSSAETVFGVPRAQLLGRTSVDVFGVDEARRFQQQDKMALADGGAEATVEQVVHDPARGDRVVRIRKVALGDEEGSEKRYILAIADDITEEKRRQEEITHLASHDSLTGLANRWLFQQQLNDRRGDTASSRRPFAVHYVDLDGFKSANDTWGHPIGDEILKIAAERMRALVRKDDVVARLGGDEFAVLQYEAGTRRDIEALAGRLVEALSRPYVMDGVECLIGASVGVAAANQEASIEYLIQMADQALYDAKRSGKGRFVLKTPRALRAAPRRH